ncbi:hypothetical protein [Sphingomonas sp. 8AM]|uniref:hypothetical protein n=1 Tax=Sphingomonas sp. 8AM TaxID=2653170 RepID=UPI0012F42C06|nr:hypothetical protein [Sphingomonas sp. 8AM]VXC90718.1 hypothetical protein SPHINGO8AM_330009 [Sphingomonas sp. 8AM]
MAVSTIERRRAALFAALAADGRGTLIADRVSYLASTAAGGLVATLTQAFGAGTTFELIGAAPAQLALASGGRIVAGTGAATVGSKYEIKVRATSADGRRDTTETLTFIAGFAAASDVPANALLSAIDGQPLISAIDGQILTGVN